MSTRAIIAEEHEDGTLEGVWNWYNGYDIYSNVKKLSRNDLHYLLDLGDFACIYTEEEYKYLYPEGLPENEVIKYNDIYIHLMIRGGFGHSIKYRDIHDILSEDINVAYILHTDGKWKKYT